MHCNSKNLSINVRKHTFLLLSLREDINDHNSKQLCSCRYYQKRKKKKKGRFHWTCKGNFCLFTWAVCKLLELWGVWW